MLYYIFAIAIDEKTDSQQKIVYIFFCISYSPMSYQKGLKKRRRGFYDCWLTNVKRHGLLVVSSSSSNAKLEEFKVT